MNRLEIVKRIIYERENSQLIPLSARSAFQRVKLSRIYELLVVLRILLTLNLQTGWIHQDEFANSLEVVAGDYFNLQVFKPEAYNASFPTRSLFFLHATILAPYIATSYHLINEEHPVGKELIPNSQLLILIPRLVHVGLSFIVDFMLLAFCRLQARQHAKMNAKSSNSGSEDNDEHKVSSSTDSSGEESNLMVNDHSIRLVTLASSQILLIFATRTHSSAMSLIFYSILLYLVSHSMYVMEETIPVLNKYHKINTKLDPVLKVRTGRELKAIGYSPLQHLHWITLLIVAGLFNDPDFFLSYACVPLFFYCQRGISNPHIGMTHFHARIFTFLAYFCAFSIPFVLWDSFFYGRVTFRDFYDLNLSTHSFVITPVNYFATKLVYLRDFPTFIKVMLNYLLMFNILGLMGLTSVAKEMYDLISKDWKDKPKLDSQWVFLNCSWFVPLVLLIQYKSPFDLGPLIFPLVYMHGHKIPLISRFSSKIGLCWFVMNLIGLIYWGYLSQGGILTSFLDLYDNLLPIRYNATHVDIIISQISAIPPTFALALPLQWKTVLNWTSVMENRPRASSQQQPSSPSFSWTEFYDKSGFQEQMSLELPKIVLKFESAPKIRVLHTGNSPLPLYLLENELSRLINAPIPSPGQHKVNLLILPSHLRAQVNSSFTHLRMKLVKTYWNHLHVDWTIATRITQPEATTKFRGTVEAPKYPYKYNYPNVTYGLDLYHFGLKGQGHEDEHDDHDDEAFDSLFKWGNDDTQAAGAWLAYAVQCAILLLTGFLFIMSYVTFTL